MPLRVQLFHTRHAHFGTHSGIHQFVRYLDPKRILSQLRSVTDGDDDLPRRFPLHDERVRALVRRVVQMRGQVWYRLSDLAAEGALFRPMLSGKVDLLHFIDGEHTAQFLPAIARNLRLRVRTVATYHQSPAVLPDVVVPSVVRNLDHVTLMSSSQLEWFQRFMPREQLSIILHGIDTEFFSPDGLRSDDGMFRCITTGSYLRDWALLDEIARCLDAERRVQFHVVSNSAPAFENCRNVIVHRQIDDAMLRALYRQSDLLVLPLTDATANNALLEGMASGLPVVASDLPSLREYAPPEAAVFLPRDAGAFSAVIQELAADEPRRVKMGRAARARAEALSWSNVAGQYVKLYLAIAGGCSPGRTS